MGKAGRWLRSVLTGKNRGRDKALSQPQGDATPLTVTGSPREKKRWSFRRPAAPSPATRKPASPLSLEPSAGTGLSVSGRELDEHSEKAAEVAVAARLTEAGEESGVLASWLLEEAAAARIQATFRGYLARKALCALRGLVKLQALIRGQLVRRQANATLRRMQALVSAQSRLRAQRSRMLDHQDHPAAAQRRSPQHPRRRSSYEMDRSGEEHVKIVEMDGSGEEHVKIVEVDVGGEEPARRGRSSCSAMAGESRHRRLAEYYYYYHYGQCSPAPSSAELSPLTYSGHMEELLAFDPARSSSPDDDAAADSGFVPSYMANTESSLAKARSQSAPRQRTDAQLERQPSRRRGAPRKTMQRSASHISVPAAAACGYQYPPWAGVRLDRSSASLVGSECGSTSSVLTAGGYCRSLVGFEVHRAHYRSSAARS